MQPLPITQAPKAVQRARLDNITLVPASLLPFKTQYQPLANKLPMGSVLCVPGTPRQQKIIASVKEFFKTHGHTVYTLPFSQIAQKKPARKAAAENLSLAF